MEENESLERPRAPFLEPLPARSEARIFVLRETCFEAPLTGRLVSLLSAEERERFDRMKYARVRDEYLATRALGRLTLARFSGKHPAALRFSPNEWGRPFLDDPRDLHFNLTNTRGLIACIVGNHAEIGIDAEYIDRNTRTIAVADRFFSKSEVADLMKTAEAEQRRTFFRYWTLKEAYIKARGMGLAIPLGDFSFSLFSGNAITVSFTDRIDDDPSTWRFAHHPFGESHFLSTAVRGEGSDVALSIDVIDPARDWVPQLDAWDVRASR